MPNVKFVLGGDLSADGNFPAGILEGLIRVKSKMQSNVQVPSATWDTRSGPSVDTSPGMRRLRRGGGSDLGGGGKGGGRSGGGSGNKSGGGGGGDSGGGGGGGGRFRSHWVKDLEFLVRYLVGLQ